MARHLNNKGGTNLEAFWNHQNVEWGKALNNLREGPLSLNEEAMIGRLEDHISTMAMPLCMSSLEWKAWQWPGSLSFQNALAKVVYEWLSYKKDWHLQLNKMWGVARTMQ